MRTFYEEWRDYFNSAAVAAELKSTDNEDTINAAALPSLIRQPLAAELSADAFVGISFTHHCEILAKAKDYPERIFYIHQAYINK